MARRQKPDFAEKVGFRDVATPRSSTLPKKSNFKLPKVELLKECAPGYNRPMIKTLNVARYITPLREGGSLPAIVEADDGELYVMKFVGAGQGAKALIAELVAGEIGRTLGLPVPEIVFMTLDPRFGNNEAHDEIRDLLQASAGLNLALRYLPKAFGFNPLLKPEPDPGFASAVVWFDAYTVNVDRTPRNPNILWWQNGLWLIDHGAALYFHHGAAPDEFAARSANPFPMTGQHVLLPFASALEEADLVLRERLSDQRIDQITAAIPDEWLDNGSHPASRAAYADYLKRRLAASDVFLQEAIRARSTHA